MKHIDPRYRNNFLDANFWDSSGSPVEDSAMSDILGLYQRARVNLVLPFSVKAEIEHPNTPPEVKRHAASMIYTCRTLLTPGELALRAKILKLIQGNAKPGKHDRDVSHLFEAQKHGGGYFITKDVRLLRKNREVENLLTSLRVVRPSEFMEYFRSGGAKDVPRGWHPTLSSHAHLAKGDSELREFIYQGFIISPMPAPLVAGGWTHQVQIRRDREDKVSLLPFSTSASFATREEAVTQCLAFGKQIIDGKVPNCSVNEL